MKTIKINQSSVKNVDEAINLCPFSAIEYNDNGLSINSSCRFCQICIKKMPDTFELIEEKAVEIDKSQWQGIAVYIDHYEGDIHPVSYELIGKAKQMAARINQKVYALFIGKDIENKESEILSYGVDEVVVYDQDEFEHFRIEPYTKAMEDFINYKQPAVMLVGGTTTGRSLAPRCAARFKTGLTADCTILDIQENSDLDQIRPAFGGNIMAHIHTPNHRPQFATVRYKIFDTPEKSVSPDAVVTKRYLPESTLMSGLEVLASAAKSKERGLEDAEVIVVAGRGIKKEDDLQMVYKLADCLNAEFASTRPLIEAGWTDPRKQIGLSGRTVKPKLLICCGVSGSVQFAAGMQNSENIIAINTDKEAPIFNIAHYAIHGDLYEIIPDLINKIEGVAS